MKRLGLIINPVAGIGGRVGLKGSDGLAVQQQALARGAQPWSEGRARLALEALIESGVRFKLLVGQGKMGETLARELGLKPQVVTIEGGLTTTAEDTIAAAREMKVLGVDLLLFAGGDGTARDIHQVVGQTLPVLGIPAGVKIHSAAFAVTPWAAGEIAASYLKSADPLTSEAEVADLDEERYRAGVVSSQLYGYLNVPYLPNRRQNRKAPTPASEAVRVQAIAEDVSERLIAGWLTVLGPGTTSRAVAERMGWQKTLLGVDVYDNSKGSLLLDADEAGLLEVLQDKQTLLVLSPTGGQGFLLGRGNQQLSPRVLRLIGKDNLLILSPVEKLIALGGQPLRLDTGDAATDRWLAGYKRVIVGYHQTVIYKVE